MADPVHYLVQEGRARAGLELGSPWEPGFQYLEGSGVGNLLLADGVAEGPEWTLRARLTVLDRPGSAASLVLGGDNHVGLGGRDKAHDLFLEGPLFGGPTQGLGPVDGLFLEDRPFDLVVTRRGGRLKVRLNGRELVDVADTRPDSGTLAFRPRRGRIRLSHWSVELGEGTRWRGFDLPASQPIWTAGEDGYHTYRIPALLPTPSGALLAFCEGRREGSSDSGDIDLVLKRSEDGGRSWSENQVVWDDGANTCGNPCPVVDAETGTIWLLLTHNRGDDREPAIVQGTGRGTRTVWVCSSQDDGRTWSAPREITSTTKDAAWGWYATGPGVGVQLREGAHAGRLVVPCDHSFAADGGPLHGGYDYGSHVIFSDDHGASWQLGGTVRPRVNECQVAELPGGELVLDMRSYFGRNRRRQARSGDGGMQWSAATDVEDLVEPVCQASLIRIHTEDNGSEALLLFANPASTSRARMSVRWSRDGGRRWSQPRLVHPGAAAYSSLAQLADDRVGLLYESGGYAQIAFTAFPLAWVLYAPSGDAPSPVRVDK